MAEPSEGPLEVPQVEGAEPTPEPPDHEIAKHQLTQRLEGLGVHVESTFVKEEDLRGGFKRHHWHCKVLVGCTFGEEEVFDRYLNRNVKKPTVTGGKVVLESPYFCGVHVKGSTPNMRKSKNKPTTVEVVECVLRDASAIDYASFEEWAPDLGYEKDSRSAEKVYRTCLSIGLKLRSALGDAELSELRELANRL